MKKQLPILLFAIACVALLVVYVQSNKKINQLEQSIAVQSSEETISRDETPIRAPIVASRSGGEAKLPAATPINPPPEEVDEPGRRFMKSIANLMDNPSINKLVESSQRAALSTLYTDLIDYLNLNEEESAYFMDLLMKRQMATFDYAMNAMGGDFSPEELAAMEAEIQTS